MRVGVVVYPGSNCDRDCGKAVQQVVGTAPVYLWHKEADLKNVDAVVVPGGFSYGDYLRCGAIARFSPITAELVKAAKQGLPVLGICNGFQILTESGLLPGALMRNKGLHFICETTGVRLNSTRSVFTASGQKNHVYQIPIAHMDGNYFIDDDGLKRLQDNDQIVFSYADNPNGSIADIAGVCDQNGRVLGMMPHPERVVDELIGGVDGRFMFENFLNLAA